jgi:hypothetical protein
MSNLSKATEWPFVYPSMDRRFWLTILEFKDVYTKICNPL